MIRRCSDADTPAIEAIVNEAAQAYRGVIAADCLHEPYMPRVELLAEIAAGVQFWGWEESGSLVGVMGIQSVGDVTLIRHAYVLSAYQGRGVGGALLDTLVGQSTGKLLVGTWTDAEWAIRFYQRHGFRLVPTAEKDWLLNTYWKISERQRETSVVLVYAGERKSQATSGSQPECLRSVHMAATSQAGAICSTSKQANYQPVAPAWHTVLMILLVMGPFIEAKLIEMRRPGAAVQSPPAVQLYIVGAVVECVFFVFAWWGVRLRKQSLATLIGVRWSTSRGFARDIGLAFLFWGGWYGILSVLKIGLGALGLSDTQAAGMVYPNGPLQAALWIPNAILAGIAEETVFRGYLMKQFTAWTRSVPVGVVLQAILFGVCHGYLLGHRQMLVIATSGLLIGTFTLWRRSILPAVVFHSWADLFGALIVRGLPFK